MISQWKGMTEYRETKDILRINTWTQNIEAANMH